MYRTRSLVSILATALVGLALPLNAALSAPTTPTLADVQRSVDRLGAPLAGATVRYGTAVQDVPLAFQTYSG